ncbi:MAG: hypothetical protein ACO3AD_20755 [Burkholderiaceae bacterium]
MNRRLSRILSRLLPRYLPRYLPGSLPSVLPCVLCRALPPLGVTAALMAGITAPLAWAQSSPAATSPAPLAPVEVAVAIAE